MIEKYGVDRSQESPTQEQIDKIASLGGSTAGIYTARDADKEIARLSTEEE